MINWIERFDLFLFDFDGLLVDTEPLHYRAFMEMLRFNQCNSDLTFVHYLTLAHANSTDLRDHIYTCFPKLFQQKPDWEGLRREKGHIYVDLLKHEPLQLLPGVEVLLETLQIKGKKRCVVTNSPAIQVEFIKFHLPILSSIPHWITREHYAHPKPSPEGYLKAIAMLADPGDQIIGFEDSFKGLQALKQTPARALLITPHKDVPVGVERYDSLDLLRI